MVITLSQIYTKAQDWGIVAEGTNPCRHVELYRQRKRERFLTEALENGGATPEAALAKDAGRIARRLTALSVFLQRGDPFLELDRQGVPWAYPGRMGR